MKALLLSLLLPAAAAPRASSEKRSFAREESGAIMVIGVFMGLFLVGMLYYLMGVGQAILFRERMQDAADSVTFSYAMMNARGMNLIVLINFIMACLMAILIFIKAVELVLITLEVIVAAICCGCGPWCPPCCGFCPVIEPTESAREAVADFYDATKEVIDPIIEAAHTAEVAVRNGWPVLSQVRAVMESQNYNPPVAFGAALPFYRALPTEDSTLTDLCNHARDLLKRQLHNIFGVLPQIPLVTQMIEAILDGYINLAAMVVCNAGDDGSRPNPPPLPPDTATSQHFPQPQSVVRCCSSHGEDTTACNSISADVQAQRYDDQGNCSTSQCTDAVNRAPGECAPGAHSGLNNWDYQMEYAQMQITVNPDGSMQPELMGTTLPSPTTKVESYGSPKCGSGGSQWPMRPGGWCEPTADDLLNGNSESEAGDNPASQLRTARSNAASSGHAVNVTVRYWRVKRILGCSAPFDPSQCQAPPQSFQSSSSDDNKVPQRLKSGVNLGDEDFIVRGFSVSTSVRQFMDGFLPGVQIAAPTSQRAAGSGGVIDAMMLLGSVNIAEAEYFYSGSEDRAEWMWNMKWTARLRRFRMPSRSSGGGGGGGVPDDVGAATSAGSGGAGSGGSGLSLSFLEGVIIH